MSGEGRHRAPAHQNTFAYRHNPNSKKTKKIMALPNEGLCRRCHDIVEWRKKYRKYKPLTKPGKCQNCHQPKVRAAYHQYCQDCAGDKDVCAKCLEHKTIWGKDTPEVSELKRELDVLETTKGQIPGISERERRTMLRELQRELETAEGGGSAAKAEAAGEDDDDDEEEEAADATAAAAAGEEEDGSDVEGEEGEEGEAAAGAGAAGKKAVSFAAPAKRSTAGAGAGAGKAAKGGAGSAAAAEDAAFAASLHDMDAAAAVLSGALAASKAKLAQMRM